MSALLEPIFPTTSFLSSFLPFFLSSFLPFSRLADVFAYSCKTTFSWLQISGSVFFMRTFISFVFLACPRSRVLRSTCPPSPPSKGGQGSRKENSNPQSQYCTHPGNNPPPFLSKTKAVVVPAAALDLVYPEVLRGEFEGTKQSTCGIRIEHY